MNQILDENYIDLIVDNALLPEYNGEGSVTKINERYSILHVLNENPEPCDLGEKYQYYSIPAAFSLMSETSLEKSGISAVQGNPYLALYGKGVLIGVVDTGIDYRHPAFIRGDNSSRIISLWDQSIQAGTPPDGFSYGTEYTRKAINLALRAENPLSVVPSMDDNGHGTAIASIIAGGRNDVYSFRGVVPESELVVVKLKQPKSNILKLSFIPTGSECFQETDIMLGIKYLVEVAQQLKRPMAICFAMGSSQGDHNGLGTLDDYLNRIVQTPQIGVAIAAGNEGNNERHYYVNKSTEPYTDTFELKVSEKDTIFAMEIWSELPSRLSLKVTSPTGETTREIPPRLSDCDSFSFIFERSKLWVNNYMMEKETGDQLILVRFEGPNSGIWRFQLENLEGEPFSMHAWLPVGELLSNETYFLKPSPNTTITYPGNAHYPLTVTAYDSSNGSIVAESGKGYTRDGFVVPDITAPGFEITCAYPDERYGSLTGTGAAVAHTTGTVAMLFEWGVVNGNYTSLSGNDANRLIVRGADRDKAAYDYPNSTWGYGVLDIYNSLKKINL